MGGCKRTVVRASFVTKLYLPIYIKAMEAQAFSDMCRAGSFPTEALAIQRYVREKGGVMEGQAPRTVMFHHEYR